jgi:hypothetical protein
MTQSGHWKPLFRSRADCRWLVGTDAIAQAELIHRQFPKDIGIADAALRPSDDFLGDKSRRWIVNNFQMQRIAGFDESGRHILDGFRVKSLTRKERSNRHDALLPLVKNTP